MPSVIPTPSANRCFLLWVTQKPVVRFCLSLNPVEWFTNGLSGSRNYQALRSCLGPHRETKDVLYMGKHLLLKCIEMYFHSIVDPYS